MLNVTLYKCFLFTMNMSYCNFRGNNLLFLNNKLQKHLYLICSNLKKNNYWQVCYPFIEFLSFITQQGETLFYYFARITAAAPLKASLNTVCFHIVRLKLKMWLNRKKNSFQCKLSEGLSWGQRITASSRRKKAWRSCRLHE